MTKWKLVLGAATLFALAGQADAGEIFLTAYKDGKQTEIRDTKTKKVVAGKQVRVFNQAEYDKLTDTRKKDNAETVTLCGAKYYLSKRDSEWLKAHQAERHDVHVRDHVAKGKYEVLCPRSAETPPAKKDDKAPAKKPDPKKSS